MNYSKGVIAIPKVTGDIVITVTTESVKLVNLFDSTTASYNYRIRNVGALGTGVGSVVSAPIDIGSISTLTVQGITEVINNNNIYARLGLYSSSTGGETDFVAAQDYTSETYSFDIAALKAANPTATHLRLQLSLTYPNNCSASDTANLAIYGS